METENNTVSTTNANTNADATQEQILKVLKTQLFHRRLQTIILLAGLVAIIGIYPKIDKQMGQIQRVVGGVENKVDSFDIEKVNTLVDTAQGTLDSLNGILVVLDEAVGQTNEILTSVKETSEKLNEMQESLSGITSIFGH